MRGTNACFCWSVRLSFKLCRKNTALSILNPQKSAIVEYRSLFFRCNSSKLTQIWLHVCFAISLNHIPIYLRILSEVEHGSQLKQWNTWEIHGKIRTLWFWHAEFCLSSSDHKNPCNRDFFICNFYSNMVLEQKSFYFVPPQAKHDSHKFRPRTVSIRVQ